MDELKGGSGSPAAAGISQHEYLQEAGIFARKLIQDAGLGALGSVGGAQVSMSIAAS